MSWKDTDARVRARVARELDRTVSPVERSSTPRLAAAGVSHELPRAGVGQHLTRAQREKYESLIAYTKNNIAALETQQLQIKLMLTRPGIPQRDIEQMKMQRDDNESRLQDLKVKLSEYQQLLNKR
jgi:predicted methyltransferase